MNEQKTKAECRDKDGRKNTGGEILLQYNGSFRKDSGLPVGSALIHDPPEQFWSRDAFQKVDNNKKKERKEHIFVPLNKTQSWDFANAFLRLAAGW